MTNKTTTPSPLLVVGLDRKVRGCAILFPRYSCIEPEDATGCTLEIGHDGPHEFVTPEGETYQWETDWECGCEECMKEDGDMCYLYGIKTPNAKLTSGAPTAPKPEK